jgi:hypothetical protein
MTVRELDDTKAKAVRPQKDVVRSLEADFNRILTSHRRRAFFAVFAAAVRAAQERIASGAIDPFQTQSYAARKDAFIAALKQIGEIAPIQPGEEEYSLPTDGISTKMLVPSVEEAKAIGAGRLERAFIDNIILYLGHESSHISPSAIMKYLEISLTEDLPFWGTGEAALAPEDWDVINASLQAFREGIREYFDPHYSYLSCFIALIITPMFTSDVSGNSMNNRG